MIIHRKQSKVKNKFLPTCFHGNYGDSLGEFSNSSYGIVGAERVKKNKNSSRIFEAEILKISKKIQPWPPNVVPVKKRVYYLSLSLSFHTIMCCLRGYKSLKSRPL